MELTPELIKHKQCHWRGLFLPLSEEATWEVDWEEMNSDPTLQFIWGERTIKALLILVGQYMR